MPRVLGCLTGFASMNKIYAMLVDVLKGTKEPVILDIGAHFGQDSFTLRQLFRDARLWSFEPDPRNIYRLHQQGIKNISTLVEAAIGDQDGTAVMNLSNGTPPADSNPRNALTAKTPWSQSSSLKKPKEHLKDVPWVKFDKTSNVTVMKLDTFFAREKLDRIDVIWADVQGAEDQMIAGGQHALANTRYLYTEYDDREVYEGQLSLKEIMKRLPGKWIVLEDFGYDALIRNAAFDLAGNRVAAKT